MSSTYSNKYVNDFTTESTNKNGSAVGVINPKVNKWDVKGMNKDGSTVEAINPKVNRWDMKRSVYQQIC